MYTRKVRQDENIIHTKFHRFHVGYLNTLPTSRNYVLIVSFSSYIFLDIYIYIYIS